ncbi:MAG TPA: hypothetical protein DGM69_05220 [Chloroflexi bacterium]|nr:hypothetical protein [Chloroflexota bacterium]
MTTSFKSNPNNFIKTRRNIWTNFDWGLMLAIAILTTIGIAMIRSSTFQHPNLFDTPIKQIQYALVGAILIIILASIDYRYWQSLSKPLYILIIITLSVLFVAGVVAGGAQRWFDFFGLFFVQPSELAKIGSVIWIANFFAIRKKNLNDFKWVLLSILHAGLPAALVMAQPDLSSAIMIIIVWISIIWAAEIRIKHLAILSTISVSSLPFLWFIMEQYQRNRVINFINPQNDPGAQYNVRQAIISIGSGGWFGQGYNQASQVQLRFLKVRHTDFIFSATAAEFGFVGALIIMLLFVFITWRILRIGNNAQDPFGSYLCYGMAIMIFAQAFFNIGMNLNLLPVIGLPLPFFSYGGSALLTLCIGLGIVQSVAVRQKQYES